jgi:hypothetical protein
MFCHTDISSLAVVTLMQIKPTSLRTAAFLHLSGSRSGGDVIDWDQPYALPKQTITPTLLASDFPKDCPRDSEL